MSERSFIPQIARRVTSLFLVQTGPGRTRLSELFSTEISFNIPFFPVDF